jgi:putative ABC transport system ATP-binding protein
LIAVSRLTRYYRRGAEMITALDAVNLEVHMGELTVAAGPSGSGKTTLLSILAGYETPDAGRIVTLPPLPPDVPPAELSWRHVGYVPQSVALLDELTIAENVDLPARLATGDTGPPTGELLHRLDIAHLADRFPSQTSGGEQQRTAIGRALRLRPHLLVADEPTGHQDRARIDTVLQVLREHAYAGHAVLVSSHDQTVIGAADRVVTLTDGRLVSDVRAGSRQNRAS